MLYFISLLTFCVYLQTKKLMNGKALRKQCWHEKIAASVLLKTLQKYVCMFHCLALNSKSLLKH